MGERFRRRGADKKLRSVSCSEEVKKVGLGDNKDGKYVKMFLLGDTTRFESKV